MDGSNYLNYTNSSASSEFSAGFLFALLPVYFVIFAVGVIALWKVFSKAGKPGWAAVIPVYNVWVLAEIAGKPGWWGLVMVLVAVIPIIGPIVSMVLSLIISMEIAKKFGRSTVFGVIGLWLFSLIGYLILAFGKDTYKASPQPAAGGGTPEIFAQNNQGDQNNT